jgi:hypothetical protein
MTVVWYIIAHAHQVCAANLERQNQSILSRSEPGLNVVSQSSEQLAQAKPANHSWQTELSNSVRQPSPYKPTVVYVYVRLNTGSQINLPDKTYNVSVEMFWNGKMVDWLSCLTVRKQILP